MEQVLFLTKKIVSFFIQPLGLLLFLAFLIFLLIKWRYFLTKVLALLLFAGIFLFSYAPVANYLSLNLESKYPKYNNQQAKFISVLGNGHYEKNNIPISSSLSGASTKRVLEAISIYQQISPKPRVIFTGYAGLQGKISNAKMAAKFAKKFGIDGKNIIILGSEKDTIDEAKSIKNIVKNNEVILITSAMHLHRATIIFKKSKIKTISIPADFYTNNTGYFSLPKISYLQQSNAAIHEYLGIAWLKLKDSMKKLSLK